MSALGYPVLLLLHVVWREAIDFEARAADDARLRDAGNERTDISRRSWPDQRRDKVENGGKELHDYLVSDQTDHVWGTRVENKCPLPRPRR